MVTFYTDGSCWNVSHLGGCAWVRILPKSRLVLKTFSRAYSDTSSNRMELLAIIHALESVRKPSKVHIFSDSMYCIKVARSIATRTGFDGLANKDLWHRYKMAAMKHRVEFTHVKGHRGDTFNELADKLAGMAHDEAKVTDPVRIKDTKMGATGLMAHPSGSLFKKR